MLSAKEILSRGWLTCLPIPQVGTVVDNSAFRVGVSVCVWGLLRASRIDVPAVMSQWGEPGRTVCIALGHLVDIHDTVPLMKLSHEHFVRFNFLRDESPQDFTLHKLGLTGLLSSRGGGAVVWLGMPTWCTH